MREPKKCSCNYDCDKQSFLEEACFGLAKDIIELDERRDRDVDAINDNFSAITEWAEKITEDVKRLFARPILKEVDHFENTDNTWLWVLLWIDNIIIALMLFWVF